MGRVVLGRNLTTWAIGFSNLILSRRILQNRTAYVMPIFLCSWICSPLKYFSVRSHELLPRKCRNRSPSPQNESEFSPRSIQSCLPLLQGPSCRKSPSALFRSNWVANPRPISNIFRAKPHANALKATSSTDCKSNCIRIGLSRPIFFQIEKLKSEARNQIA